MFYNVYRVAEAGMPRDHHAIFVETTRNSEGHIFQVTGNIQSGMVHDDKPGPKPEETAGYIGKILLGRVAVDKFPRIKSICESVPAPKKQFDLNRRLYPQEPLRRCQEWTAEAIEALVGAGVLQRCDEQ